MPPLHQHSSDTPGPLTTARDPPRGRLARRTGAAAVAAAVALALGGCGGSDSSTPAAASTSSASRANPPMATVVTIGQVAGAVHKPHTASGSSSTPRTCAREVGKAVDAWFDGGFVGVDYPTTSFPDARSRRSRRRRRPTRRGRRR